MQIYYFFLTFELVFFEASKLVFLTKPVPAFRFNLFLTQKKGLKKGFSLQSGLDTQIIFITRF